MAGRARHRYRRSESLAELPGPPASVEVDETRVQALIAARKTARDGKDFAEADRIRDELAGMGVALKDGPDGTTWEIAR